MSQVCDWLAQGGGVMIVLVAVSFVMTFLLVERFLAVNARMKGLQAGRTSQDELSDITVRCQGLRRVGIIHACIVIAPLLGLLGTVTGMIDTFTSILGGGDVRAMSNGIRKALSTTQLGLAIAAPGLMAWHVLTRRIEKLELLIKSASLNGREART
jgi:biopolymer transport protein ExbB